MCIRDREWSVLCTGGEGGDVDDGNGEGWEVGGEVVGVDGEGAGGVVLRRGRVLFRWVAMAMPGICYQGNPGWRVDREGPRGLVRRREGTLLVGIEGDARNGFLSCS